MLWITLAFAEVPLPTYPECGTPDRLDLCPADMGQDWALLSYIPQEWQHSGLLEGETATGVSADLAWRTTTGRTDVVLAVLDSGILWDEESLLYKHYLNIGELPLPQTADGLEAEDHDLDGNGVVNVADYEEDPRIPWDLADNGHPTRLDPADLIEAFSDGVDDDDNGFVDDVSGWDFLWNDNDPYDDTVFDHGTYEAKEAAREGGDETGSIGVCPNCMVLSLRVGDSFVADGTHFGAAVLYAVEMEAAVIQEALGTLNHPEWVTQAISHAWDEGVLTVASAADETAYHHNSPGWVDRTLYVHSIVRDKDDKEEATTWSAYSNCTNHGARLQLSASSSGCSSGATAMTSGAAGLVISAGRDMGIELTPGEVVQLLQMNAVDIHQEPADLLYPSTEGWDRYFGYGRLHAADAVEAVVEGRIPPSVEILSPGWFEPVKPRDGLKVEALIEGREDATWVIEAGWGDEPTEWELIGTSDSRNPTLTIPIGSHDGKLSPPTWTGEEDPVERETAVNLHTLTIRVTATDASGDVGEARKAVTVIADPDWREGFPLNLGSSLESSPNLADVDGDGVLDIVQADGSGQVHVLHGWGTAVDGWPVSVEVMEELDPDHPDNHLPSEHFAAFEGQRAGIIGTAAVGDLDGDGDNEVVVGSLRGLVWAWHHDGTVVEGFPVEQDPITEWGPDHLTDEGFFSSPALEDVDDDGDADIVIGGMDQQVYAWDEDGERLSGFPVRLAYPGYEEFSTRIISSPAVGDVDEDGRVEIVIGTNETLNGYNGAIYVLEHDGSVKDRWPQAVFGAYTQVLPYVGEGVPVSPALADLDGDGDLEIAAWTQAGEYNLFHHTGDEYVIPAKAADRYGSKATLKDGSTFPLITNPSFGDLDNDGVPELVSSGTGSDYAVGIVFDGRRVDFAHSIGAWSADGDFLDAFPRPMEDMMFFANPAIGDIDGDQDPEIIVGTGGFLVHAIDKDGDQPAGWPKLTGQWNMASPAVGDIDGDGLIEVVSGTRGGWLYVWSTPSPAGANVGWASFGHDPANTGNHEAPLPEGYNSGGYPDDREITQNRCWCSTGPGGSWPLLLIVLAIAGCRRPRW